MPLPTASAGLLVLASAAATAVLTMAALGYARRRSLLDLPGRRRSHVQATPRGGGVGLVLVVALGALYFGAIDGRPSSPALAFAAGLLLVGLIGWIDDHRPLPALLRLVVHALAAAVFVASLPPPATSSPWLAPGLVLLKFLLLVTAVNFWNFMDGINGLVSSQSAWTGLALMWLFGGAGDWGWSLTSAVLAVSCLAFLPFNFPRARIFLGDAGSGGLGFCCGALLLLAEARGVASPWLLLPIVSALSIDASLTLLHRIVRGRRWYTAHREHLYQWMVRSGRSHASTTLSYLGWNLILVLPVLSLSLLRPALASAACVAVFALGAALWFVGKRGALRRVREGTLA